MNPETGTVTTITYMVKVINTNDSTDTFEMPGYKTKNEAKAIIIALKESEEFSSFNFQIFKRITIFTCIELKEDDQ